MYIQSFTFGKMVIDEKIYTQDLIILPDRIIDSWWRLEGHLLQPQDLEEIIKIKPEILIVGQGASGLMDIPEETKNYLSSKNIQLIAVCTEKAYHIFNQYQEEKKVSGAFHLTC